MVLYARQAHNFLTNVQLQHSQLSGITVLDALTGFLQLSV